MKFVMAGLVPAIHAFTLEKIVDARHEAGHDEVVLRDDPCPGQTQHDRADPMRSLA